MDVRPDIIFFNLNKGLIVKCIFSARPDQMIVTWVTQDYIKDSYVEYGINSFKLTAQGTARLFTNGGDEKRNITIHRVVLSNLTSGETYCKQL